MGQVDFEESVRRITAKRRMPLEESKREALVECMETIEQGARDLGLWVGLRDKGLTDAMFSTYSELAMIEGWRGMSPVLSVQAGEIDAFFFIATDGAAFTAEICVYRTGGDRELRERRVCKTIEGAADDIIEAILEIKRKTRGAPGYWQRKYQRLRLFRNIALAAMAALCIAAPSLIAKYENYNDPFLVKMRSHVYD